MSSFRRRQMLAAAVSRGGGSYYGPNDYIQNGLVFQLDGFNIDNSAWVDRIGGITFPLTSNSVKHNGYLQFMSAGSGLSSTTTYQDVVWPMESNTVEIVISDYQTGNSFIFGLPSTALDRTQAIGMYNDGLFLGKFFSGASVNYPGLSSVPQSLHLISAREDKVMIDGGSMLNTVSMFDNWYNSGYTRFWIGGREASSPGFVGKIHAIRVYNRKLSEVEMRYNQTVDSIRFGISPYILFADPIVAQICATNWGDGVGITPSQAAAVTSLTQSAFVNNTTITSFDELQYFTGLTSIVAYGFYGCSNLASVVFPDTLPDIGAHAFNCSGLTGSITIPASVNHISGSAFANTHLTTVTVLATTPPTLDNSSVFPSSVTAIYVPAGSVSAYQAANNWSSYASIIQAIP